MPDDLTRRRAAWEALSALFLDTEPDLEAVARLLHATGFSAAELTATLRGEVAPVLGINLLSVTGVWTAFDLGPVEARYLAGRRGVTLEARLACRLIRREWREVLARLAAQTSAAVDTSSRK